MLFIRSVLTLASATAIGQLIVVLATPLLTRLYTPKEFGVFSVFMAVTSILIVISSLRYELAIPLPRNVKNARSLLDLALSINIATALLSVLVVFFFRESIANVMGIPRLTQYLWLVPVTIVCAGSYKALNYWAIRQGSYKLIGRTKVIQGFSNVATQLIAGFAGFGVLGLIFGMLAGQTAGIASLAKGAGVRSRLQTGGGWGNRGLVLLKKHHRFPKYDAPAALLDVASMQLPSVLLAALFNPAIAGFYLLAQRVLSVPMTLVGQAVGQVMLGGARDEALRGKLSRMAIKTIFGLAAIIVLPAFLIFFYADSIFDWVFGNSWREAGSYASWMILGIGVQFLYSPISVLLVATNGQHLNLIIHGYMLIGKAIAVMYGYHIGSSLASIIGFSLVGGFGYAIAIGMIILHTRRHDVVSQI